MRDLGFYRQEARVSFSLGGAQRGFVDIAKPPIPEAEAVKREVSQYIS